MLGKEVQGHSPAGVWGVSNSLFYVPAGKRCRGAPLRGSGGVPHFLRIQPNRGVQGFSPAGFGVSPTLSFDFCAGRRCRGTPLLGFGVSPILSIRTPLSPLG